MNSALGKDVMYQRDIQKQLEEKLKGEKERLIDSGMVPPKAEKDQYIRLEIDRDE
jgi:hypothetical protein